MELKIYKYFLTNEEILNHEGVVRVGSTENIEERYNAYKQEKYYGTMCFYETNNMKTDETFLIQHYKNSGQAKYNVQEVSNKPENVKGYCYIIVGEKQEDKKQPNPFIIFSSLNREAVKQSHPDYTFGQISKELGELWKMMSHEDKHLFY